MKVAHVITEFKPSGPANVVKNIIDNLPVEVENKLFYFRGPPTLNVKCDTEKIDFKSINKLEEYDVIHSHGLRPDFLNAYFSIRSRGHKHLSTLHNYAREELLDIYGKRISTVVTPCWFMAWHRMNALAVLTQNAKVYYKKSFKYKRLEVMHNGIDMVSNGAAVSEQDMEAISLLKDKYILLGANAHIIKRKGLDIVVKALVDLPDCALMIVGEGPYRQDLESLAKKHNVDNRCLFLGYRSNAIDYLSYYDIYMMPSTSEGFGLALIEAMASGVPCVCSNIPVFREILNSQEGAFFELQNQNSLVTAVHEAIRKREDFSTKSKEKYKNEYTGAAMANKYFELYKSL